MWTPVAPAVYDGPCIGGIDHHVDAAGAEIKGDVILKIFGPLRMHYRIKPIHPRALQVVPAAQAKTVSRVAVFDDPVGACIEIRMPVVEPLWLVLGRVAGVDLLCL